MQIICVGLAYQGPIATSLHIYTHTWHSQSLHFSTIQHSLNGWASLSLACAWKSFDIWVPPALYFAINISCVDERITLKISFVKCQGLDH